MYLELIFFKIYMLKNVELRSIELRSILRSKGTAKITSRDALRFTHRFHTYYNPSHPGKHRDRTFVLAYGIRQIHIRNRHSHIYIHIYMYSFSHFVHTNTPINHIALQHNFSVSFLSFSVYKPRTRRAIRARHKKRNRAKERPLQPY